MTISVSQTTSAIAPRCPASFRAIGGTAPYVYSIASGGAGGTINSSTGAYVGPEDFHSDPTRNVDTIIAVDAIGESGSTQILVGTPLLLFCDIIAHELCIPRERVYLWDQKIMQPTDFGLFVAISVATAKPFGSSNRFNPDTNKADQFVSMMATLDVDVISRGPTARDRKEEIILALNSDYAKVQQTTNAFKVGTLSNRFINLSEIDGAAIPYRFRISVNMQYVYRKNTAAAYYTDFNVPPSVVTDF